MKNYVRIQSTQDIRVTPGLQGMNFTKNDSDIPNRLKVQPIWTRGSVLILKGAHCYPADIVNWDTVKCLVKDKVLTIGQYMDFPDEDIDEMERTFKNGMSGLDMGNPEMKHTIKNINLEDIAGK